MRIRVYVFVVLLLAMFAFPSYAVTMCDTSYQNCRVPLINLIKAEKVGIDVGMWFMEDMRYAYALIAAHQRGVRVRVIMNTPYASKQVPPLDALRAAGVPMRLSIGKAFHTKAMIFAGQSVLEISGANFTGAAFKPEVPYVNYTDEAVAFITEPWYVQAAMWEFDNQWTDTVSYIDYSNAPNWSLYRAYPWQQWSGPGFLFLDESWYVQRVINLIRSEPVAIDIIVYRFTHPTIWHELHIAQTRGVRVRLISDPRSYTQWRSQTYLEPWRQLEGAYYFLALGGQYKQRIHRGLTHEKMIIFHGMGRVLIGSQNLTHDVSHEWNVDFIDPNVYWWSVQHFNRKWNSPTEFEWITQWIPWW